MHLSIMKHIATILLLLFNLVLNNEAWVAVDPVMVGVAPDAYGRPRVDLGTLWNFFGYGYRGNTNWLAGPGQFFSKNINSIMAPGGPFSFGSFWGWPVWDKK